MFHVVAGADAGEQAVAQGDGGVLRWHKTPYLRQYHDERHLSWKILLFV